MRENLERVRDAISKAASGAGRQPDSVQLVAVSKTKPLSLIEAAVEAGQRVFGENYAQEASEKISAKPDLDWHFIGSLQSNKVKFIVGRTKLIESVDRLKLGQDISRLAVAMGVVQEILVQVHLGDEESKSGVAASQGAELVSSLAALPGLRLRGLMALPPLSEDERVARRYFAELRGYLEAWRSPGLSSFDQLSMGTSADFAWAIAEGATLVRVGTALFGGRAP